MDAMRAHRDGPGRLRSALARHRAVSVSILLGVTIAVVSAINPAFLSAANFRDILVQAAPWFIIGAGMTLVIVTGEIDISVGSLFGLLAALMGVLASPDRLGLPVGAVVPITLAAGAAVGLINGALVTFARVPSIIVTLGMLTILRGAAEQLIGDEWIRDLPASLRVLGTGSVGGVPISLWAALVVVLAAGALARRTRLGLRIFAVGGNAEAAAFAGTSVRGVKLFVFTLTGFLTGVAALVSAPQLSVIEPGLGAGYELVVVTAVLIGGTSIRGGEGGVLGTVIGAALLGSVRTALIFMQLGDMATYWERAIQGAFILAAVLVDHFTRPRGGGSA